MTQQESFKKRVRERMSRTGERYSTARRQLLSRAEPARSWAATPETSDDAVRASTGKGWEEWRRIIDGHGITDHAAIASRLQESHGLDGWWAQTVTVGYERIIGLRLPYQRPDGTFSATKSRTLSCDPDELRSMLLDSDDRAVLLGDLETELRSSPQSKSIRIRLDEGTVLFTLDPVSDGRTKATVTHERLARFDDVARWKEYWSGWLAAVDEASA